MPLKEAIKNASLFCGVLLIAFFICCLIFVPALMAIDEQCQGCISWTNIIIVTVSTMLIIYGLCIAICSCDYSGSRG
jgi:hypothetical protein